MPTTKGGRWSKKRFNRIKEPIEKEEDSEDSNPVQIEFPVLQQRVGT